LTFCLIAWSWRIANTNLTLLFLFQGLRGDEDPALVKHLVDFVHSESEAMIKKEEGGSK
jgi:hypothetical protein